MPTDPVDNKLPKHRNRRTDIGIRRGMGVKMGDICDEATATNEVLLARLRKAVETSGYYNFLWGRDAEKELRRRGVKVWLINWHQSDENILSDTRLLWSETPTGGDE